MCAQPYIVKVGKVLQKEQPVPCGYCPDCKRAKLSAWLFRFEQQLKVSINPLFVTLTYRREELVYGNSEYPTLYKRDLQLFLKRLRKAYAKITDQKLVYYAVGEYGTKRKRPHYHIILFNLQTSDDYKAIETAWGKGRIDVSQIRSLASIKYTLKYVTQKDKHKVNGCQPEFSTCSQGIGKNYLTDKVIKYHKQAPQMCFVRNNHNQKLSLPKYYKDKIYTQDERLDVSKYNHSRAIEAEAARYQKFKDKYKDFNLDEHEMLNLYENSKLYVTLPKRANQSL